MSVYRAKNGKKWAVHVVVCGKSIHIGKTDCRDAANRWLNMAKNEAGVGGKRHTVRECGCDDCGRPLPDHVEARIWNVIQEKDRETKHSTAATQKYTERFKRIAADAYVTLHEEDFGFGSQNLADDYGIELQRIRRWAREIYPDRLKRAKINNKKMGSYHKRYNKSQLISNDPRRAGKISFHARD